MDVFQHVIEGVGEQPEFILSLAGGAHGIIMPLGNGFSGFHQSQDWPRNLPLQEVGEDISQSQRADHNRDRDAAVRAKPLIERAHVGVKIEGAHALPTAVDGLEGDQMRSLKDMAIRPR